MIKKIFFGCLLVFTLPMSASVAGLSISPARLDFTVDDGGQASQNIMVMNPTSDVMVFEVYADEFSDVISLRPESFTLESGGRKKVSVMIDASSSPAFSAPSFQKITSPFPPSFQKRGPGGVLSTNISVVGKALAENKINIAAGAKLPIAITMTAGSPPKSYAQNGIVIVALLIISLLLIRKLMDGKPKNTA